MAVNLDNYVDVPSRLRLALQQYPMLRVQELPVELVDWPGGAVLLCTVKVWRDPDDPHPAIATATEAIPGRTPYTKGSELMNGMTSALGRALGYMGFGINHSIASANEVQAAQHRNDPVEAAERPAEAPQRPQVRDAKEPPSPAQLAKLRALGYGGPPPETKLAASRLIDSISRANENSEEARRG